MYYTEGTLLRLDLETMETSIEKRPMGVTCKRYQSKVGSFNHETEEEEWNVIYLNQYTRPEEYEQIPYILQYSLGLQRGFSLQNITLTELLGLSGWGPYVAAVSGKCKGVSGIVGLNGYKGLSMTLAKDFYGRLHQKLEGRIGYGVNTPWEDIAENVFEVSPHLDGMLVELSSLSANIGHKLQQLPKKYKDLGRFKYPKH